MHLTGSMSLPEHERWGKSCCRSLDSAAEGRHCPWILPFSACWLQSLIWLKMKDEMSQTRPCGKYYWNLFPSQRLTWLGRDSGFWYPPVGLEERCLDRSSGSSLWSVWSSRRQVTQMKVHPLDAGTWLPVAQMEDLMGRSMLQRIVTLTRGNKRH